MKSYAAMNFSALPDEYLFDRVLSLERRRTERTGDPFVLMVLDIARLNGSEPFPLSEDICRAIRAKTRDTDFSGWYQYPTALGSIFTALRDADRRVVESTLAEKTERALHEVLEPEQVGKVSVSFHFFPEGTGGCKPDDTLYPDLKKQDKSKAVHLFLKRTLDIGGSLVALLLFSPVFLAISALIKLTSKGPVLFRQRRIGKFGKEFWFLKFRTMHVDNDPGIHREYIEKLIGQQAASVEGEKPVYKIVNDPRVTPFGRFLRSSSLDELPQFINVLLGDMSLVGPRPPIPYEIECYRSWHRRRVLEVKPGITGLWQVAGRSSTTFDEMVRLDLQYVREQSIWLDLKIIFKTPGAVLSAHGAY